MCKLGPCWGPTVQAPKEAQENGEVFWVVKAQEIKNAAQEDGEFLALWY
jgi:hypothetical protein